MPATYIYARNFFDVELHRRKKGAATRVRNRDHPDWSAQQVRKYKYMDTLATKICNDINHQIHVLESRLMTDHEHYNEILGKIKKHFELLKDMLQTMSKANGQEVTVPAVD